ncbi:MAG TPA: DUF2252 domain-containing protein [Streptosporangiaceae bacterium]|jgi:uncharacterized protein (DUF2252 family)
MAAPATASRPRGARRFQLETDLPDLTPQERAGRGKAARAAVPRSAHAAFDPPQDRPDPIDQLAQQAESRVQELVPVRYGRMLASPFAYFRGAALPMASDLSSTPVTGFCVQACGDAHLSNFGIFGSPERQLVFDINDFDETLPGPWEWDVKRLAASLEVATRDNGFSAKQRRAIVLTAARQYREAMREFAGLTNLQVWYAKADVDYLQQKLATQLTSRQQRRISKEADKARTHDSMKALSSLTTMVDGRPRITPDPPLVVPVIDLLPTQRDRSELEAEVSHLIDLYKRTIETDRRHLLDQYQFAELARKVVGVGSVGTQSWIVLMLGRDNSDPLFLQVKEAQRSVLSTFSGASKYANQGQRVVAGQRLMQAASDIFLGWQRVEAGLDGLSRDFYVRQLKDWKYSLPIEAMVPSGLRAYGEICGWTLARAHARSGDRIAIAAYLGAADVFDQAIADFAAAYADQNQRDYDNLAAAAAAGRIAAEPGV